MYGILFMVNILFIELIFHKLEQYDGLHLARHNDDAHI